MESLRVDGLTLRYDANEGDAAVLIRDACAESVRVIRQCWGLEPPTGCTVFVMTSWAGFAFRAAPWHRRLLLAVFFPLWSFRAKRIWRAAGGWVLGHGQVPAVGIKPPRLITAADRSVGDRLFIRDTNVSNEVRQITCHELTHAFSNHLRLPTWLHEGLAMVSVDRLRGRPSVRLETLDLMEARAVRSSPSGYPRASFKDADAWVYLYARGYWLTRYLADRKPQLLRTLLSKRRPHKDLEGAVAASFELSHGLFWNGIDEALVKCYRDGVIDTVTE